MTSQAWSSPLLALSAIAVLAACTPPAEDDGTATAMTLASAEDTTPTDPGEGTASTPADTIDDADGTASEGPSTTADATTDATTGPPPMCEPVPSCDAVPPPTGPLREWEHFESTLVTASGSERHRGRDMFYNPGDTHWAMAKFAYGPTDWDLSGEQVDLYLLRNCLGTEEADWEPLGPAFTTFDGDHPTVEGVEDSGGWVFFQIPMALPLGRHRVHFVVRGDASRADAYIEVVEPGTPIILSDIDGTLTTDEWERLVDFLQDNIPDINPGAPEALHALVDKGYRPMYLTARPEFLGNRTYDFVEQRGLPPGIIHTTLSTTGALGSEAVTYKTGELQALAARGLVPAWVFGNTDSDATAYDNAGIMPLDHRIFFQFDDPFGGRRIESYQDLVPEFEALDPVCE
ncbi:LNS2 domain-containing protein [Paraliomyxa miuraensis]|uniref:LNS2 domain-containing protein n=1 Tax=Paraliomyxa miuraensis TaxID=376150 RepID=UPI002252D3CB|nr:phosphatidylinositol transfer protein [Paraliomyxa miuraensis]MCX4241029.1 phosphatidylinositol transfer protein [Paraliomyxa miuraensis]